MERRLLYVNRSEESPTLNYPDKELLLKARNTDKETLLLVIEALLDNNAALRKYIDLIEKDHIK